MIPRHLDCQIARQILDFSGGGAVSDELAEMQLEGAVALYNAIHDPNVGLGYLADEVGMGKTYIALGVVALMRFFNPALRVLYIAPSENVQSKWIRDYRSFVDRNVLTRAHRVRGMDGEPVAPYARCDSLVDLIRTASSGYQADFFVRNGSFSFGLNDNRDAWVRYLATLQDLLPAFGSDIFDPDQFADAAIASTSGGKHLVKDQFARAVNYVLPDFDLVVIDEAHNFKKSFDTSDRNRVLSQVLGMRAPDNRGQKHWQPLVRVKNALLLSATPFDRDLEHLRNQLALVGKRDLLDGGLAPSEERAVQSMSRFMVRRLNRLNINGKAHTRNMYRVEWRSGEKAEIPLGTDDRRLVTALVQKKVGDVLGKKHGSMSFQMGLLASFESYAETTKSPLVQSGPDSAEFDSDANDVVEGNNQAPDREVVAEIADSYSDLFGVSLPHPKMDGVVDRLAKAMFERGEKQLVFVRRVKSVKEIKRKLDERYDEWLKGLLRQGVQGLQQPSRQIEDIIRAYEQVRSADKQVVADDEITETGDGDQTPKPKNDNLFNWWFRGDRPQFDSANPIVSTQRLRDRLTRNRNVESLAFEINWVGLIAFRQGISLGEMIEHECSSRDPDSRFPTTNDFPADLKSYQRIFLRGLGVSDDCVKALLGSDIRNRDGDVSEGASLERVRRVLDGGSTLFEALDRHGLLSAVCPDLDAVLKDVSAGREPKKKELANVRIHLALLSTVLRTGHGIVDLYLAFLRAGANTSDANNVAADGYKAWLSQFAQTLKEQSRRSVGFSTWQELKGLALRLDSIVKLNAPEVSNPKARTQGQYLAHQLNPIAPVLAASGEVSGGGQRSAQARKFRMPGYPLALVSTNVFQEGEDLHLFCDSVTHYGISSSPVSIEQKNGRVDRIGSMAQERLKELDRDPHCNDLIQVFFPHIPESIERLQIRQLCVSMNEYIESLQEVESSSNEAQAEIDADQELQDRSEIPPQNWKLLDSRFKPRVGKVDDHDKEVLSQAIGSATEEAAAKRAHTNNMLESLGLTDLADRVEIRSARSSGELLLRVSRELAGYEEFSDTVGDNLLEEMLQRSWQTLHRVVAKRAEVAKGSSRASASVWDLFADAEILLGDAAITQHQEVQHLIDRLDATHDPGTYQGLSDESVRDMMASLTRNGVGGSHVDIAVSRDSTARRFNSMLTTSENLIIEFPRAGADRQHVVSLFESHGDCVMLSCCVKAELIQEKGLTATRIIELTWQRNASTDIVEFMLDPDGNLVGRCVHPIASMQYREFEYCVHTLAAECDRLEYVVHQLDRH